MKAHGDRPNVCFWALADIKICFINSNCDNRSYMFRTAYIFLSLLMWLVLIGCAAENTPQYNIPNPSKISEGCIWSSAKLPVFESQKKIVKFRYQSCLDKEQESVFVDNNGNDVIKLSFDVVTGSFSIFEQGAQNQEAFVHGMIDRYWEHDGICEAKKLKENIWKIDDGKSHNAEINFMPCGRYGRNFSGETIFIFKDGVVLNLKVSGENDDIDFSSIEYQSEL